MREYQEVQIQSQLDASLDRLKKIRQNIDKGISMFEAARNNCASEYSPWSYNLLGSSNVGKSILDDVENPELNNSMVDDLVAKVLDDDYSYTNCNQQPQIVRSNYLDNCPAKLTTNLQYQNGLQQQDYSTFYNDLANLTSSRSNKENFYVQRNLHPSPQQQQTFYSQMIGNQNINNQFVPSRSYMPFESEISVKDPFNGHVQQSDFSYNMQLLNNLSELGNLDQQTSFGDSSNFPQQRYRPASAMTNVSADSGFISNSSLPPFSPPDCFLGNFVSKPQLPEPQIDPNILKFNKYRDNFFCQQQQQQQNFNNHYRQFNNINNNNNINQQPQQQQFPSTKVFNKNNFPATPIEQEFFNQLIAQRQRQQQRISGRSNSIFSEKSNIVNINCNNSLTQKRSGSSKTLYLSLEQTYDQFKLLEQERKRCEATLTDHYPGKKVSSANNMPIPRLSGNPSRVDRLIIDNYREHARVITLVAKMERLRGASMNQQVHKAMECWLEAIKHVQDCRKQEITNVNKRQKENLQFLPGQEDKDILLLANSIYKLTQASRQARTGMYNALQATLLHDSELEKKVLETRSPLLPAVENTATAAD